MVDHYFGSTNETRYRDPTRGLPNGDRGVCKLRSTIGVACFSVRAGAHSRTEGRCDGAGGSMPFFASDNRWLTMCWLKKPQNHTFAGIDLFKRGSKAHKMHRSPRLVRGLLPKGLSSCSTEDFADHNGRSDVWFSPYLIDRLHAGSSNRLHVRIVTLSMSWPGFLPAAEVTFCSEHIL